MLSESFCQFGRRVPLSACGWRWTWFAKIPFLYLMRFSDRTNKLRRGDVST